MTQRFTVQARKTWNIIQTIRRSVTYCNLTPATSSSRHAIVGFDKLFAAVTLARTVTFNPMMTHWLQTQNPPVTPKRQHQHTILKNQRYHNGNLRPPSITNLINRGKKCQKFVCQFFRNLKQNVHLENSHKNSLNLKTLQLEIYVT